LEQETWHDVWWQGRGVQDNDVTDSLDDDVAVAPARPRGEAIVACPWREARRLALHRTPLARRAGGLWWHGCDCYAWQLWQAVVSVRAAARCVRMVMEDAAHSVVTEKEGRSCGAAMVQPRAMAPAWRRTTRGRRHGGGEGWEMY
jgi:hypothetical protein